MRQQSVVALMMFVFSVPVAQAEPLFDNPKLNKFVADLRDKSNQRHYELATKQSAIHKWFIRECMQSRGLAQQTQLTSAEWHTALHGKYAYCEDHHIPGIDPPCPDESIIRESIDSACWQQSYNQIDWGFNIMHHARGKDIPQFNTPDRDLAPIESDWSACMASKGHQFKTRFEFFASRSAIAELTETERSALADPETLQRDARHCFDATNYDERRTVLLDSRISDYFLERRDTLEAMLLRYEKAEHKAGELIKDYCLTDREAIVAMAKEESYSDTPICPGD